jgi:non-ribosomal peptide synthetase component F
VLAKGCALLLVLLVVSPVTAPFRTLDDLSRSGATRTALTPLGSDPVCVDDAALTNDPLVGKSIRFGGVFSLAAVFGVLTAPLPTAGTMPVPACGAPAGRPHLSPVLRL